MKTWMGLGALALAGVAAAGDDVAHSHPAARYLALGDSYTIGEAVGADARWPVQLTARLHAEGIALAPPRIIATIGWTTDELDAAIDREDADAPLGRDWALVSLLIGVNNQYRGRSVADFAPQFARLLERAIGHAGDRTDRVLVLSIPDWGQTPFGQASGRDLDAVSRELDAYNAEIARQCAARGVAFIDITPHSREVSRDGRAPDADLIADDGLHPGPAMYAYWADRALAAARRALGADAPDRPDADNPASP
jgi:lysophospholipase L1-like esterase